MENGIAPLQHEPPADRWHLWLVLFDLNFNSGDIYNYRKWFLASSCHHPLLAVLLVFPRITVNSLQTPTVLILATLDSLIQRVTGLYDPSNHSMALSIVLHVRAPPSIAGGSPQLQIYYSWARMVHLAFWYSSATSRSIFNLLMIPQSGHTNQRWAFTGIHWKKLTPWRNCSFLHRECVFVCGKMWGWSIPSRCVLLQAQHCGLISLILFLVYYNHKSLNIHVGRD